MNNYLSIIIFLVSTSAFAQVGINETNPKATLDVKSHATNNTIDGFVFPTLTLSELTSKGNNLYTSDYEGAIIYLSDVSQGDRMNQRTNISTLGYYFFDGTLWQKLNIGGEKNLYDDDYQVMSNRILNLDGKTLSITNVTSIPKENQFSIDGNTFSVDAINNRVGIGTSQPVAKLDARTVPSSVTDPGEGSIGLGTIDAPASSVGAGAIRYTTTEGGVLQYSNGTSWFTIQGTTEKAMVIANKTDAFTILSNRETPITNWTETVDNQNLFNNTTGTFTAPRMGNYLISFSYGLKSANYAAENAIEAQLITSSGNNKKSLVIFNGGGNNILGSASITFLVRLAAQETIRSQIWHATNTTKFLLDGANATGYNNFSVVEL